MLAPLFPRFTAAAPPRECLVEFVGGVDAPREAALSEPFRCGRARCGFDRCYKYIWYLVFGIWYLVCGIWCLVFGI